MKKMLSVTGLLSAALLIPSVGGLAADDSDFNRLARDEQALRERVRNFRAADRISREDLHERRR